MVAGCTTTPDGDVGVVSGTVTVSAAASLADAFATIGEEFEAAHPGTEVELNLASSATLARQINEGAPADVFASADEQSMTELEREGGVGGRPVVFARNDLVVVVPRGNPDAVTSLNDLPRLGTVSLCTPTAPCGRLASEALARAGVDLSESTVNRTPDVRSALGSVTNGDADAAIVYRTDARAAGSQVATVTMSPDENVTTDYLIAVVTDSDTPTAARAFVEWVTGAEGRAALQREGFSLP